MRVSLFCLVLFFSSFLFQLTILTAQFEELRYSYCFDNSGSYTNTSTYNTNLKTLLSNLTSDTRIDYGFYNSSNGQSPDRANAIGLCRGDIDSQTCRNCLNNASNLLTIANQSACPHQMEAMGGFDECMLRYSNRSILGGTYDDSISGFSMYMWNVKTATNVGEFMQEVSESLLRLLNKSAGGDSRSKFALEYMMAPNQQLVSASAQCTPDLSQKDCTDCLVKAISEIPNCCDTKIGGRVIKLSCNIRFESGRFDDSHDTVNVRVSDPSPPPSPSPDDNSGEGDGGLATVYKIVAPVGVTLALFGLGCYFLFRRARKRDRAMLEENFGEESSNLESLRYNLATIEAATNKFSIENRIGRGGFGEVYKGTFSDGQEIAVKRLSKSSVQGALEFKNEVLLIAKLQHRNLVALKGFCLEHQEKILIYEYVPNKSIDVFLFDATKRREFSWSQRFKVLVGIARGLFYLHEQSRLKIIHRDLKPSNILLDNNMNAKISDFGMARMVTIDEEQGSTIRIVGTYGYMSPEYVMHGHFSEKSDVFSYGVIILEVISGKRNSEFSGSGSHLLSQAWRNWHDKTPLEILDPFLIESCSQSEAKQCVQIGLLCVQDNPDDRPTMAQVVTYLSNLSIELPFPREPALFMLGRNNSIPNMASLTSSNQFSQISKPSSTNEMSNTVFFPR